MVRPAPALASVPALLVLALLGLSSCGKNDSETPIAIDQAIAMPSGQTMADTLDAQRRERENAVYVIIQQPAHGVVQVDPSTGTFDYTSVPGYPGPDAFTWQVSDGHGTSSVAVVTVQVVAAVARVAPRAAAGDLLARR